MEREAMASVPARPDPDLTYGQGEGLTIRSGELIVVIASVLGLSILLWNHNRVPEWKGAAGAFAFIACIPLLLRLLQRRLPDNRLFRFVVDFGPVAYVLALYFNLNPVLDAVNIPLADEYLIRADQRIFGTQISIWMAEHLPPLWNDVFLAAYTTYFAWPVLLGLLLWWKRKEILYDEWVTALMFFFAVNYALYAVVPAMGPRYYQAAFFDGPVQGLFFAEQLDLAFRGSPLARDCFPSGHTGVALLVLGFAWREERRFFWIALPVLICLILGTLAGRFHYGVDLLAAVPLTALSLTVAGALKRRMPAGLHVSRTTMAASFRRWREGLREEV